MTAVPALRVAAANGGPLRADGEFVLYWMIAARRPRWNFALDRAVERALELGKPLLVFEALRCGHRWAAARFHARVSDGMRENGAAFERAGVAYWPWLEPEPGAGRGLLAALARRAAVVVTDEFPCFFLPRMVARAASSLAGTVLVETVDSNGLLPLRAAPRAFERAVDFRRFLQRELPAHLADLPAPDPLPSLGTLARPVDLSKERRRWAGAADVAALPVDQDVAPVEERGGFAAAAGRLDRFVARGVDRYGERNDPGGGASSGLSADLHWGHLAAHQVLAALAEREGWNPSRLPPRGNGSRQGWWGFAPPIEGFLDQLVTWRELGYVHAFHRPADNDRWESLPEWARRTLDRHAADPRPTPYDLDALEAARTHDPLWNAAQRQLLGAGRIHNYLRMLWGKKILEWSPSPQAALERMIHLNNKYALDGRNPNSYSGIFWCLGRHDRPWPPERPIFGTVRFMSSASTARKFDLAPYLARWGTGGAGQERLPGT